MLVTTVKCDKCLKIEEEWEGPKGDTSAVHQSFDWRTTLGIDIRGGNLPIQVEINLKLDPEYNQTLKLDSPPFICDNCIQDWIQNELNLQRIVPMFEMRLE